MSTAGRRPEYDCFEANSFWQSGADLRIDPKELDEVTQTLRDWLAIDPFLDSYRVPGHETRIAFCWAPYDVTYRIFFSVEDRTVTLLWIDVAEPNAEAQHPGPWGEARS